MFKLLFTDDADSQLNLLEKARDKKSILKAVRKTLGLMETNLRHPSLRTHEYHEYAGSHGKKVFESYAQNRTPGAYRIFWHYGPQKNQITVLAIVPHP
jgi:hypothetical protein